MSNPSVVVKYILEAQLESNVFQRDVGPKYI